MKQRATEGAPDEPIDLTGTSSCEESSPRCAGAAAAAAHQSGHAAYWPGIEGDKDEEPEWAPELSDDEQAGAQGDACLPPVRVSQMRAHIGPVSPALSTPTSFSWLKNSSCFCTCCWLLLLARRKAITFASPPPRSSPPPRFSSCTSLL